jgi:hypothetical protein
MWRTVYGVHRVQVPVTARCVGAGALVLNCSATIVAPILRHQLLLSLKRGPYFHAHKTSRKKKNWWWIPTDPENEVNCAGEAQQQFTAMLYTAGARGSIVVKALCYKPEGRRFETW